MSDCILLATTYDGDDFYCPNCSSPKLTWLEPGHPASDYSCPKCGFWYQLKSQKTRLGIDSLVPTRSACGLRPAVRDKFLSPFPKRLKSITDGAYDAMMNAIRQNQVTTTFTEVKQRYFLFCF